MKPRHLLTILALSPQASSLHDAVNYPVNGNVRGLAFSDSNIASNRYLYNGKKLEDYTLGTSYLGTLDYGARHYDPRIARWTVPDPMAEKYYGINPYAYCAGNPVMMVDPSGNDTWEINKQGEVVSRRPDKKRDVFFIVTKDDEGNYQRVQTTDADGNTLDVGISFEYGTVLDYRRPSDIIDKGDGNVLSIRHTLFEIKGDERAAQLFEFMANPLETTHVEWTHAKIGTKKTGKNIVGTSHNKAFTGVGNYLRKTGYTLREVNHNHPSGIGIPSKGDLKSAQLYLERNSNTVYICAAGTIP